MCDISFSFISSRTSSDSECFLSFSIETIRWWRGYSWRKAGIDLKLTVSGFIKDFFVLKVEIDFRELKRISRERFGLKGFWHISFHGKILTIM